MDRCKHCGEYHQEYIICDEYIKHVQSGFIVLSDEEVIDNIVEVDCNLQGDHDG